MAQMDKENDDPSTQAAASRPSPDPENSTPSIPIPRAKIRTASYNLSSASSAHSTSSRKGRYAEPGTTDTHSDRASISMPPPGRPVIRSRTSSTYSQRASVPSEALRQGASPNRRISKDDFA